MKVGTKKMKLSNRAKSALASAGLPINDGAMAQLVQFASQNSGIDPRNYGLGTGQSYGKGQWREAYSSFRSEARSISEDWRRFKAALAVAGNVGVTDADVIAEAPNAYSGRLGWGPKQHHDSKTGEYSGAWSYCTGQYFPTEYRKAAAAVLEAATRRVRQARPPIVRMPATVAELRYLNEQNGGCWFSRGAMRFFGTRIESEVIAGHYFITSEQPPHGSRGFTIRSFDSKGDVATHGELCGFETMREARASLLAELQAQPMQAAA